MSERPLRAPFQQFIGLVAWLGVCAVPSIIGLPLSSEWYREIAKPEWHPPGWIFGPVWTVLYVSMAIAAWLVWRRGGWQQHKEALSLFLLQLGVNAIWTPLFFGLRSPMLALVDIVFLWFAVLVTIVSFSRVNGRAAALLLPYFVWVSFASVLNYSIWRLNSG